MGLQARLLMPPLGLTLLVAATAPWLCRRPDAATPHPPRARRAARLFVVRAGLGLAGIVVAFIAAAPSAAVERAGRPLVTLYEPGFHNWVKPDFEAYGHYGLGMLGVLPDFVERLGCRTQLVKTLDPSVFADSSALVFVNQDKALRDEEYAAIDAYVRRGGSLLVIGDHTFVKDGGKNHLNRLVEPYDIRFRFDTANFFIGGWLHSYRPLTTPVGYGAPLDWNEVGLVAGCGLDVSPPAWSAVVGKYGYSDEGSLANAKSGYLGDMKYRHGEKVGDVPLVACQEVGDGRVMAVGDTTAFTNTLLPHSCEFVNSCLTWLLLHDGGSPAGVLALLLALAALLAGGVLVVGSAPGGPGALALAVLVGTLAVVQGASRTPVRSPYRGRVAVIDTSHLPAIAEEPGLSLGAHSLGQNFVRNGYVPLSLRRFEPEELPDDAVFVLLSPRQALSADDTQRLLSLVRRGGLLLVSGGPDDAAPLRTLLAEVGVEIGRTPLGKTSVEMYPELRGVTFNQPYVLRPTSAEMRPRIRVGRFTLVAERRIGRGEVVVVGDPRFFLNLNLETGSSVLIGNVVLLKELLDEHAKRHAGD